MNWVYSSSLTRPSIHQLSSTILSSSINLSRFNLSFHLLLPLNLINPSHPTFSRSSSSSSSSSPSTLPTQPFQDSSHHLDHDRSPRPKISSKTISILRRQAIENARASYDSLPPLITNGSQNLQAPKSSITTPGRPKLNLIENLPKIGLKFTQSFKSTDAYALQFAILPRPSSSPSTTTRQSKPSDPSHHLSSIDSSSTTMTDSLIDRALRSRSIDRSASSSSTTTTTTTTSTDPVERQWLSKMSFGIVNEDPSCHKVASPLLVVSHKKLQKLVDLINRSRMSVDRAILEMRFSHKAIAAQVLDLLINARRDAIERGFRVERLIVAEAWVTKGFHTTELQVRARGRHGKIQHPTAKVCMILRESTIDPLNPADRRRDLELRASKRRLNQRGTILGHPVRLPADGILPTSVSQRAHWAW